MSAGYADRPFIAIWETTRACALRCQHCRAEAIPHRDPDELTTDEGKHLIDRVAAFGAPAPILVLTGGDPLRRPDIAELVAYGTARDLSVSLTPSGTGAATAGRLAELKDAGLTRLAVSLDGAGADSHDAFRGVQGSHRHTWRIIHAARALGLPLQINTTVCKRTLADLPALSEQVEAIGVALWALFFLIPVGRASTDQALDAEDIEYVLEWAATLQARAPFPVKTTEAPHYRRVLDRRGALPGIIDSGRGAAGGPGDEPAADVAAARPGAAAAGRPAAGTSGRPTAVPGIGRAAGAVTDGNGFVFVDHVGRICPSGFLPLEAGNVRRDDLVAVYREHPLFVALRDSSRLGGRCGRCEYREVCRGSRARAWALTGDPFAEDPGCVWQPGATPALAAIAGGSDAPEPAESAAAVPTPDARDRVARPGIPETGDRVAPPAVTDAQVTEALRAVIDPELGLSVVDLGLIYGIEARGGDVSIRMTLTAPGCPIHDLMADWVRQAVGGLDGVERVDVDITFDPPWTPDRMARR